MLVWLYLSMTRAAIYSDNQLITPLNRTVPVERDALLNLFLMLCPESVSLNMLPRLERLHSVRLTEMFRVDPSR